MIENDNYNQDDHLVLSYEILTLLTWLVEHEQHALQALIKKALANGLGKSMKHPHIRTEKATSGKKMQATIINFFAHLDYILSMGIQEDLFDQAAKNDLLRSLEHIDTQQCDNTALVQSVEQATRTIERHPHKNAKELFFKELLYRWNPKNNEASN